MSCQEEISNGGVYYTNTPPAPAVTVADTSVKPPASLFGKDEGLALAGTGDAVETLSRDKTSLMRRKTSVICGYAALHRGLHGGGNLFSLRGGSTDNLLCIVF